MSRRKSSKTAGFATLRLLCTDSLYFGDITAWNLQQDVTGAYKMNFIVKRLGKELLSLLVPGRVAYVAFLGITLLGKLLEDVGRMLVTQQEIEQAAAVDVSKSKQWD